MARKEFIEASYLASKQIYQNIISRGEAIDKLTSIGMNKGSVVININVFKNLMDGRKFTRTLSAPTFDFFLQNIFNDFGKERLSICLNALSKHMEYLENKKDYSMGLVRGIYKKYVSLLRDSIDELTDEDEGLFPEGREKYRLHRFKERNKKLIDLAKARLKGNDPKMKCQICEFSFIEKYGEVGLDFIEAHHVFPISALIKETPVKIEDLAMVCSNCHRMLHRKRPWLTIDDLGKLVKK